MKAQKLALFAILTAILILMSFTPLGYLNLGFVAITFLMIPVVIGAASYGPLFGAGLGLVFGLTSLTRTILGSGGLMTTLFMVSPWLMGINLIVPRVLFGFVTGCLYLALSKTKIKPIICDMLTMLLGTIFHTVVFMAFLMIMFGKSPEVQSFGDGFFQIIWAMVGVNAIVEWIVCATVGAAVLNGARYFIKRIRAQKNNTSN